MLSVSDHIKQQQIHPTVVMGIMRNTISNEDRAPLLVSLEQLLVRRWHQPQVHHLKQNLNFQVKDLGIKEFKAMMEQAQDRVNWITQILLVISFRNRIPMCTHLMRFKEESREQHQHYLRKNKRHWEAVILGLRRQETQQIRLLISQSWFKKGQ